MTFHDYFLSTFGLRYGGPMEEEIQGGPEKDILINVSKTSVVKRFSPVC